MAKFSITTYIILFTILLVTGFLYRRYEDKRHADENIDNNELIRKYLLNEDSLLPLGKTKKPIMWIYIPHEYNSRNWASFGSRSSHELNQPYLYLTVRSIIQKCSDSFYICLVDDDSFAKLISDWKIDMNIISDPIYSNMRRLAMSKLMYVYGGLNVPISFLCMRNLIDLYENEPKMFVCENIDRNATSNNYKFYPDMDFMGAKKGSPVLKELIHFMEKTISNDYTAESVFSDDFGTFINENVKKGKISLISGIYTGVRDINDEQITTDDLISSEYLNLYKKTYGIWINRTDLLNRKQYEWFARLSPKQVVESNTIIGKYLLINNAPETDSEVNILKPVKKNPNWVSFWSVPSKAPMYGLKPNFLGDNVPKLAYPDN